ncbi:hypothetical protein BKA93DRAFT_821794 [Sparassis latifolia]
MFANALPSSDISEKGNAADVAQKIEGTPYFLLDMNDVEKTKLDKVLRNSEVSKSDVQLAFADAHSKHCQATLERMEISVLILVEQ